MSFDKQLIHRLADQVLIEGRCPEAAELQVRLGGDCDLAALQAEIDAWRESLPGRVVVLNRVADAVPEGLQRAVKMLWQDAVHEAVRQVSAERRTLDESLEYLRSESESALSDSRADYETLEHRYQLALGRADDATQQLKMVEAELSVMKANLSGETLQRKQLEEKITDYRNDLRRAEKQAEEMRRTFDQRMKDEQSHAHELLAKADAELTHLRRTLEQARDEAGKKESALTRNLHDLQAELVKRDVKLETQQGQIKSLDTELKELRAGSVELRREVTKLNASLLSESNRNKRLEEQVRKLEEELKRDQQKLAQFSSDALRKENDLRNQIKTRDEELMRARTSMNNARKKQVTQEETIRRLTQQASV